MLEKTDASELSRGPMTGDEKSSTDNVHNVVRSEIPEALRVNLLNSAGHEYREYDVSACMSGYLSVTIEGVRRRSINEAAR